MTTSQTTLDRAQGCLLGLAIGDAVGTTLEFQARGTFEPIDDMVGGGPFKLEPGQWTDDTSMALCLGESLLNVGFSLQDQMERYVRWYRAGHMSSTGRCFDIGNATRAALQRFMRTGKPDAGDPSPSAAGNGCLMRLAPVPIRFMQMPAMAIDFCEAQARGTHQAPECLGASRAFGELLVRALHSFEKENIWAPLQATDKLPHKVAAVIEGKSYRTKARNAIRGTGYVVESLEAALWAFDSTSSFRECILAAANLGDDADTTAAIAGQLAGAYYGLSGIPTDWRARVAWSDTIVAMASGLLLAGQEATEAA